MTSNNNDEVGLEGATISTIASKDIILQLDNFAGKPARKRTPHVPRIVPILNNVTRFLLRIGVPLGPTMLLRVRGRRTGKMHRQPIGFFKDNGRLYLFSTFGETNWVKNVRATQGHVNVGSGWKNKPVLARELSSQEAAPIIKRAIAPYLSNPFAKMILGPHIIVGPDASIGDYIKEAERHPVFELQPRMESS